VILLALTGEALRPAAGPEGVGELGDSKDAFSFSFPPHHFPVSVLHIYSFYTFGQTTKTSFFFFLVWTVK